MSVNSFFSLLYVYDLWNLLLHVWSSQSVFFTRRMFFGGSGAKVAHDNVNNRIVIHTVHTNTYRYSDILKERNFAPTIFSLKVVKNSALCDYFHPITVWWSFWYLSDDEYVVDADAEEDEGDDGVSSRVEQTEHWAQPVRQDHTFVGKFSKFLQQNSLVLLYVQSSWWI